MTPPRDRTRARPAGLHPAGSDADYLELSRHLRQLARQLVPDESSADDLVQEAWLAALDGPPARIRDLNAWLRRVVRNLADRTQRRAARRREVEERRALEAAGEDETHFAERWSVYNLVRRTVEEQREPYRSVLVARFFDERSVDEIAAASGRSPGTVRSQLQRGLGLVREALDRKHAGRRAAWAVLLVRVSSPAAERGPGPRPAARPSVVPWKAAAVLGLPLAALWLASVLRRAPHAEPIASSDEPAATVVGPASLEEQHGSVRRVAAPGVASTGAPAPEATRTLEVLVRLPDGTPAPGATVDLLGIEPLGRVQADAEGRARVVVAEARLLGPPAIAPPQRGLRVAARAPGQVWSYRYNVPIPREGATLELTTRGPEQSIAGVVVDEDGAPVAGAFVVYGGEIGRLRRTADGMPYGEASWSARSDASGAFEFVGLARHAHRVEVRAAGFATVTELVEGDEERLAARVVLPRGGRVVGTLRRPDGSLAVGARVWRPDHEAEYLGGPLQETYVDASGTFVLDGLPSGPQHVFAEEGELFGSTVAEVPAAGSVAWDGWLAPCEALRLRIEERDGTPVRQAIAAVYLMKGAPWADVRHTDDEGRVAFAQVPGGALALLVKRSAADPQLATIRERLEPCADERRVRLPEQSLEPASLRGTLAAPGTALASAFVAGAQGWETFEAPVDPDDGSYRVEYLNPGPYRLFAVLPGRGATELGSCDLAPGEERDLGVRVAPAAVRVEFDWRAPPSLEQRWVLWATFGQSGVPDKRVLVLGERVRSLELLPGPYRLAPANAPAGAGACFQLDAGAPGVVLVR